MSINPFLPKSQQMQEAPNAPIEAAEVDQFLYTHPETEYNLAKKASSLEQVILSYWKWTDSQPADTGSTMTFWLPDLQDESCVILNPDDETLYSGYDLSFNYKTLWTEEEPVGLGAYVTVTWRFNPVYNELEELVGYEPDGDHPPADTPIVIEFVTRGVWESATLTEDKLGINLNDTTQQIDFTAPNEIVVRYNTPIRKLLANENEPNES